LDGIKLKSPRQVKPGELLRYEIILESPADRPITVNIIDPTGTLRKEYSYQDYSKDGRYLESFRLPVNAVAGDWKIQVVDQITGKNAVALVEVY
jgi:uncharacterized protein YfaS (alpha-2-macroglobulin family)